MTNKMTSDSHINIDLREYSQEVIDYIIDQLPDRLDQLRYHELELSDEGNRTITVSVPIIDLVYKIAQEKCADIEHEYRHGEHRFTDNEEDEDQ